MVGTMCTCQGHSHTTVSTVVWLYFSNACELGKGVPYDWANSSTVEIVIVERKKLTLILCLLEFKTITTCDIENLTAQIHGLYNCHQVHKNMMHHVTVTFVFFVFVFVFCFQ